MPSGHSYGGAVIATCLAASARSPFDGLDGDRVLVLDRGPRARRSAARALRRSLATSSTPSSSARSPAASSQDAGEPSAAACRRSQRPSDAGRSQVGDGPGVRRGVGSDRGVARRRRRDDAAILDARWSGIRAASTAVERRASDQRPASIRTPCYGALHRGGGPSTEARRAPPRPIRDRACGCDCSTSAASGDGALGGRRRSSAVATGCPARGNGSEELERRLPTCRRGPAPASKLTRGTRRVQASRLSRNCSRR